MCVVASGLQHIQDGDMFLQNKTSEHNNSEVHSPHFRENLESPVSLCVTFSISALMELEASTPCR